MQRRPIIVGNWKMYKTIPEAVEFIENLAPLLKDCQVEVFLAVPFTAIQAARQAAQGSTIRIGAQNMHDATEGAFTGEIAAKMLLDAGAHFVLLGHSERRQLFHETNAFIHRKLQRALEAHLPCILCIGETAQERKEQKTEAVLRIQLQECLAHLPSDAIADHLLIAYEPVWAIGTGKAASAEEAQAAHHYCRILLEERFGKEKSEQIRLLYGGSVVPERLQALMIQPDIDGVLVGGASLQLSLFKDLIVRLC